MPLDQKTVQELSVIIAINKQLILDKHLMHWNRSLNTFNDHFIKGDTHSLNGLPAILALTGELRD